MARHTWGRPGHRPDQHDHLSTITAMPPVPTAILGREVSSACGCPVGGRPRSRVEIVTPKSDRSTPE
nr:hypothetical protein JVH1_1060 [Rhodococcus sp. JVH1]